MHGSDFANLLSADLDEREVQILNAVREGWAWIDWTPIDICVGGHQGSFWVSSDSIAVGVADDFLRVSLTATTTQLVADLLDAMLPTSKLVDEAHHHAVVRVEPVLRKPGPEMASTRWLREQHVAVERLRAGRVGLISSVGKDWVLTPRLVGHPDRSANYGWHSRHAPLLNGGERVYQTVGLAHDRWHCDYSQCPRLAKRVCSVDGAERDLGEVLRDPELCALVSDEGPVSIDRIPTTGSAEERLAGKTRRAPPVPHLAVPPTLRKGSSGPAVVEAQRIVGATADGIFGPGTQRRVIAWQAANGLTPDGIFGPACWATARAPRPRASPSEPTPTPATVPAERVPFVQARHFRSTNGREIDLIVLHTAEVPETATSAEAVARYFATTDRVASAHFCVDVDGTVACVLEKDIAFAAPGANRNGIQIEMAGYARQSAEDWADAYSATMLRRVARLVADLCRAYDVPVEHVDAAGLVAGKRGITTHAAASAAFKKSSHYDPGPSFPMGEFLALVREFDGG